jgi:predicted 2-oxoglutarate/Fe(II)-dependent dioxygenase YbiX
VLSDLFFRTMGYFVLPGFFTAQECEQLRSQASVEAWEEANVVRGGEVVLDRGHRQTRRANLDPALEAMLIKRIEEQRSRIEAHFGHPLEELQPLQMLIYRPGDFFGVHADMKDRPGMPEFLKRRRVSVVVFLGHEGLEAQGDQGGLLQFRDLIDDSRLRQRAYPFAPEVGTLLAFPSEALHEVTPVKSGMRYSLVTWFC